MGQEQQADILIVGGGTGGCAAAMGAAELGYRVILTEETDWIGGQITAQAVPPDEHRWIESFGCTRRYRGFREGVREFYRQHYRLTPAARANPHLNPGAGRVSRISHEPRVGLAVIEQMLAWYRATGRLRVLLRHRPVAADVAGDRVRSVTFERQDLSIRLPIADCRFHSIGNRKLEIGNQVTISARYVIDATELGDLLPLAGCEYVTGAESQKETGEPHAVAGEAQPENVQSFTWCFPVAYDPDGEHVIEKPAQYDHWRSYTPKLNPPWSGRMLSWSYSHPHTLQPIERTLFETPEQSYPLWYYRRIITREHYLPGEMPHEATIVNWPQNDYWEGNIIDRPPEEVRRHLEASKQLSLSLLYWMQTEAPRHDGGVGYPGLYLRPDLVGTEEGLAKYPYIRESRRIRAVFTVTENHVGTDARGATGETVPPHFADSVGVGCYRIDLHPSTGGNNYIDISSLPFQIPLGALIPVRMENLLPACKNLGVTHITNGCYRLHPVEWNIGESAGLLAGFCLSRNIPPRKVREDAELLKEFQSLLTGQGIELAWPHVRPV